MPYPWPGIREDIYVGGGTFTRQPLPVPNWLEAKESSRSRKGKYFADFLQPEDGWPVVTTKLRLDFSWASMVADDIRLVNGFLARGPNPIDVCTWVEISEAFYIDAGDSLGGFLKRRSALTVVSPLPPLAATRHAVAATRGDGSALTVTLGTSDADGITPWSAAGTSVGEYVTIFYTPVYRMAIADGQQAFPNPHSQSQMLSFEEL